MGPVQRAADFFGGAAEIIHFSSEYKIQRNSMENIETLYDKFRRGTCTRGEAETLLAYFQSEEGDSEMVRLIEASLDKAPAGPTASEEARIIQNEKRLRKHIRNQGSIWRMAPHRMKWYAAALVLCALTFGTYRYLTFTGQPEKKMEDATMLAIEPGGPRAILTVAEGRVIVLSEDQEGIVVDSAGIRYKDGSVLLGEGQQTSDLLSLGLTLTTPRGGYYHAILPDGTNVWLNAASTISYPSRFANEERRVRLSGEAYFEVTSRKGHFSDTPFIVETDGQEITVLGTHFNISAYPDETSTRTTVLEGVVRVTDLNAQSLPSIELIAGQQSMLDADGLRKNEVNAADYVAWKDNLFVFHHTTLRDILRQVSRWYDIDVDYRTLPDLTFFGEISRNVELSRILEMLEESTAIRFRIEHTKDGRRITMEN